MRPVHLTDLNIATRTLMAVPCAQQAGLMRRIHQNAQTADIYRRSTGRRHGKFGSGALGDACAGYAMHPPVDSCDHAYLHSLHIVVTELLMQANDGT